MKNLLRNKRLILALGAIGALVLANATGLDQGLFDEVFAALADALSSAPDAAEAAEVAE